MTNNDILRSLRYTLNLSDQKMMDMFKFVKTNVTRSQVSSWLKPDEDSDFLDCSAIDFSNFLNGLIIRNRGAKEGPLPEPSQRISNNLVLKKLKIALNLKSDDIIELLKLGGQPMSGHEVTAFFRKPDHRNFRRCKDQVLRKFLKGLQLRYRPEEKLAE